MTKLKELLESVGVGKKEIEPFQERHIPDCMMCVSDKVSYNQALDEIYPLEVCISKEMFIGECEVFYDDNVDGKNDGTLAELWEHLSQSNCIVLRKGEL